jgi:hypothetical protein
MNEKKIRYLATEFDSSSEETCACAHHNFVDFVDVIAALDSQIWIFTRRETAVREVSSFAGAARLWEACLSTASTT